MTARHRRRGVLVPIEDIPGTALEPVSPHREKRPSAALRLVYAALERIPFRSGMTVLGGLVAATIVLAGMETVLKDPRSGLTSPSTNGAVPPITSPTPSVSSPVGNVAPQDVAASTQSFHVPRRAQPSRVRKPPRYRRSPHRRRHHRPHWGDWPWPWPDWHHDGHHHHHHHHDRYDWGGW